MLNRKSFFTYLLQQNIKRPKTSNIFQPRILFITYDAIGDMAMTVPLFNALQKAVPTWRLEVLSSPRNFDMIKEHPALTHVWTLDINRPFGKLDNEAKKQLKSLYKQEFDILIYLGERISSATLWRLSKICATKRLSLPFSEKTCQHKGIYPLQSRLFDRYIGLSNEEEIHICRRMLSILPDLDITPPMTIDLSLQLPSIKLPKISFAKNRPNVLFNPNGSRENNSLSVEQVKEIIQKLNEISCNVCLFDTPENRQLTKNIVNTIYWLPSTNILMAAQWLNMMDLILTTDTSIGHIAAAQSRTTVMIRIQGPNCCEPLSADVQMLRAESEDIKNLSPVLIIQAVKQKLNLES